MTKRSTSLLPAHPLPNRIFMRAHSPIVAAWSLVAILGTPVFAQGGANAPAAPADTLNDPVRIMVSRLELEKYKGTVKGLTQFGDRRQGTKRNRDAVDWIEAQLKSYGCANVERIVYQYAPAPPRDTTGGRGGRGGGRGNAVPTGSVVGVGAANNQGGSRSFGV